MISRDKLAKEYTKVINTYYPDIKKLLSKCLVKVHTLQSDRTPENYYYLGIYYPDHIGKSLLAQQTVLHNAAENMGLVEVIFININNLIEDRNSKIRQQDFRFWLELCWIANN